LDLGYDFWKYRYSDAATGRFWAVDPLSEKYSYNSVYAFQENKFGKGVELEGLEVSPFEVHQARQQIERNKTTMTPQEAQKYEEKGTTTATIFLGGILTLGVALVAAPELVAVATTNPGAVTEAAGVVAGTGAGLMGYEGNDIAPGVSGDNAGLKFGWDNIFAQKDGEDLGKLGQGIHALQDAMAHQGVKTGDHLFGKSAKEWVMSTKMMWNDM
jgi:hypothetical protein